MHLPSNLGALAIDVSVFMVRRLHHHLLVALRPSRGAFHLVLNLRLDPSRVLTVAVVLLLLLSVLPGTVTVLL